MGTLAANKITNEYAAALHDMPKAVAIAIMASAFASAAFALPDGDNGSEDFVDSDTTRRRIALEWQTLHDAGIIPQPVSRDWRLYL